MKPTWRNRPRLKRRSFRKRSRLCLTVTEKKSMAKVKTLIWFHTFHKYSDFVCFFYVRRNSPEKSLEFFFTFQKLVRHLVIFKKKFHLRNILLKFLQNFFFLSRKKYFFIWGKSESFYFLHGEKREDLKKKKFPLFFSKWEILDFLSFYVRKNVRKMFTWI